MTKKKTASGKKPGSSSKKAGTGASAKKATPAKPKATWIVGGLIAVAALAILISTAGSPGDSGVSPTGAEADYIGRLLPAGYAAPSVADRTLYTSTVPMSILAGTQEADGVSVALSEVLEKKIVRFDYTRADGQVLPVIAYVKPSGQLFVGVSYCPPCEGIGQRIEADGTLTCDACGTKRDLETNAGISGACKLYPLDEVPATVAGDTLTVDGTVLDAWTSQPLDRPVG